MNMMIKFALPLYLLLTLAGCQSPKSPIAPGIVIEQNLGDISLKMTLLTEEELVKRHGRDENPFYAYPGKVPRKDFFVFDTVITTENSEINFILDEILLTLDTGITDNAKNRNTLLGTWDFYLKNDISQAQMKRVIKQNLSENKFMVTPSEDYKGYIVFLVKSEAAKEGILQIPAETAEGDKGIIEIPFHFAQEAKGSENLFSK